MKAYWLPGISRYARTKADAEARSDVSPYEETSLPERHQETVDFLNGMIERHEANVAAVELGQRRDEASAEEMGYASVAEALADLRRLREGAPGEPEPATAPAARETSGPVGDVVEAILELEGDRVLDALAAAIDRLHETAGHQGWRRFARKALAWGSGSLATDRGLGMLVLAGLAATPVGETD
jgi:hypothetical protein